MKLHEEFKLYETLWDDVEEEDIEDWGDYEEVDPNSLTDDDEEYYGTSEKPLTQCIKVKNGQTFDLAKEKDLRSYIEQFWQDYDYGLHSTSNDPEAVRKAGLAKRLWHELNDERIFAPEIKAMSRRVRNEYLKKINWR